MCFQPIENYGVIGNMRSISLVGMRGPIDFLCSQDFDAPTVFAGLLDDEKGGRFRIKPQLTNARIRQLYLPDSNILGNFPQAFTHLALISAATYLDRTFSGRGEAVWR